MNKKISALVAACSMLAGAYSATATADSALDPVLGLVGTVSDAVGSLPLVGGPIGGAVDTAVGSLTDALDSIDLPALPALPVGTTIPVIAETNGLTTSGTGGTANTPFGTVVGLTQTVAGTGTGQNAGRVLGLSGLVTGALSTTGTTATVGTLVPALPALPALPTL